MINFFRGALLAMATIGCLRQNEAKSQSQSSGANQSETISNSLPDNICVLQGSKRFWKSENTKDLQVRDSVTNNEVLMVDGKIDSVIDAGNRMKYCKPHGFYRKQYQFISDSTATIVLVNLFPKFDPNLEREDPFQDWKSTVVFVRDGEDDYCGIEYDLKLMKTILFQCNGPG